MLKKFFISILFIGNIIASESNVKFSNQKTNELMFDEKSEKSALEQFLDSGLHGACLETPYRNVTLFYIDNDPSLASVRLVLPFRVEIPGEYSVKLHQELMESPLLAAAVYRQLIRIERTAFYTTSNHGCWGCFRDREDIFANCYKMSQEEYKEVIAEEYKETIA
ncbi:hypothetical protein HYV11_00790 [Candidatus Dependentiae bacterium]|nr:hypothetical protein [Candidatus Dependentiae bacterium]